MEQPVTAYLLATRFVDEIKELPGTASNHPFIQWAHMLCGLGPDSPDEVPWCSSFVNAIAFLLGLPRSKSAAARSWLRTGESVSVNDAMIGFDVVVLKRGPDPQPGPQVTSGAPGHVGFFAGHDEGAIWLLGGNHRNAVTRERFPLDRILGVRRLV